MDLISEVSEELAYYLLAEKKACLPGLGCFQAVYQSAILDPSTDTLRAPAESITFDIATEEDHHFVQYLTEQLPTKDVYETFKQRIIDLLMSDTEVGLPGLGHLIANQKGEIQFEYNPKDEFDFNFEDLVLTPISAVEDPSENVASNAPRAANVPAKKNDQGMSFLRIAMLAVVSALCLAVLINHDTSDSVHAKPQSKLVNNKNNNINVSPKAIPDEVFIAAESPSEMYGRLEDNEIAEIIERQDAMTEPILARATRYEVEIITNTFGSRDNVDRQIKMIESLGYQGTEIVKGSGLISTAIILSYSDEEELTAILEKVKHEFPRAKVNK